MSFYRRIKILYKIDAEQARDIVISLAMFSGASYQQAERFANEVDKQGIRLEKPDSR